MLCHHGSRSTHSTRACGVTSNSSLQGKLEQLYKLPSQIANGSAGHKGLSISIAFVMESAKTHSHSPSHQSPTITSCHYELLIVLFTQRTDDVVYYFGPECISSSHSQSTSHSILSCVPDNLRPNHLFVIFIIL